MSGCGVAVLSDRAKVTVSGKDRVRWLNGQITNNVRDLLRGHGVYAFRLTPQGHILGDLYAFNRGESFVLDIEKAQLAQTLEHFRRYIIMDKVELKDVSGDLAALRVAGPKAAEVLRHAGIDAPELRGLDFMETTWREFSLVLIGGDNPAVTSYEIWAAPKDIDVTLEVLAKTGARPVGRSALELLRIASGLPDYNRDIHERDLPQETNQDRALSFTKGCYIGQEIVERIRSRGAVHRNFAGFSVSGSLPPAGTKIQAEGKEVGEVTSGAILPNRDHDLPVALGYLRREAASKELSAGEAKLQVASLPFEGIFEQ